MGGRPPCFLLSLFLFSYTRKKEGKEKGGKEDTSPTKEKEKKDRTRTRTKPLVGRGLGRYYCGHNFVYALF